MVQSQRTHQCRLAAGRNAGALSMSADGLHGLRADRSRCAAGLVAAYEQLRSTARPVELHVRTTGPVMFAASSDFSATNGPKVATPRRRCVASTAVQGPIAPVRRTACRAL